MSSATLRPPRSSLGPWIEFAVEGLCRLPITIGLTFAVALLAASPTAIELCQFDRDAIQAGQLWRVATGQIVHWNVDHLVWDLAVFFVLGVWCEWQGRRRYAIGLLAAMLTIAGGLLWLRPDVELYRGLSGLDSALFVWAAAAFWRDARERGDYAEGTVALAGLTLFMVKVAFEAATGLTLFVDSAAAAFEPLPLVHLLGGAAGLVVGAARVR